MSLAPHIEPRDDPPSSIYERVVRDRTTWSSSLISFAFHTLLLVLLALWIMRGGQRAGELGIVATVDVPVEIDDGTHLNPSWDVQLPDASQSQLQDSFDDVEDWRTELTRDIELADRQLVDVDLLPAETPGPPEVPLATLAAGGGLSGRQGDARGRLAAERGGSDASESAVELGLKWLVAHQLRDGGWSLQLHHPPCQGQCEHSGTIESRVAATGLALLAFLGAGYTHQSGPYQSEVDRGLTYLLAQVRHSSFGGNLGTASPSPTKMYSHAIGTMALCEALVMTDDPELRDAAVACVRFIANAQHNQGGWRYEPREPGDITVTGWQLMALKSGQMAGIDIPTPVWTKASAFLDSVEMSGGSRYGYMQPGEAPTTTAIGLLMRMYLGWPRAHTALEFGGSYLAGEGTSPHDMYYNYYATLALHHLRGEDWERWNVRTRDYLVHSQAKDGHARGSWHFNNPHGNQGGRLYTTCMAIMTLEVYYRYLPLYGWPEDQAGR